MRPVTLLATLAVALSACNRPDEASTFTLYRSGAENASLRIHVATFDADEDAAYNQENCDIAQGLFQQHRGSAVKYWCEAGRYREQGPASAP